MSSRPTPTIRREVPDYVPPEHVPSGSVGMQIATLKWERDEAIRERDDALRRLAELERREETIP